MTQPQPRYNRKYRIQGKDLAAAGSVSTGIKTVLRNLGLPAAVVRRAAIASYEAEMNAVIYAWECDVDFTVETDRVELVFDDRGPGIPDIDLAMKEGYSTASKEIREMGFGAGMGLPNIKKNSDRLELSSVVGVGTRLAFVIYLGERKEIGG
jgi:anti-sigma regulatory factor (Ser/Thr protein kinase)